MSRKEITGFRDLSYSAWHRSDGRVAQLLGETEAGIMTQIDIDWCCYCACCNTPLFLIETTLGGPTKSKTCTVTAKLATMAGIPAYCVRYTMRGKVFETFTVQQVAPMIQPAVTMTEVQYAKWLFSQHLKCQCDIIQKKVIPRYPWWKGTYI